MVNNVLAGIRDFLAIVIMLAVIIVGALSLGALSEAASQWQPAPAPTVPSSGDECIGEVC